MIALPEPATLFLVKGFTDSSITFTWAEQFNGFTEITGARLEYTVVGSGKLPKGLEVGRRTWHLTGLLPSTVYRVSLFLRNRLGLSDPVSLTQRTMASELCDYSYTVRKMLGS